jgi:pyrroloquinoline quinone (PQQ) biosynthesis protein C
MRKGIAITYLRQAIEPYDLLCHPFYKAWSAGELTAEDLREYASAYYYQVSAFPTYLSALHSRLPDGDLRRAVLRNLCDEEIDGTAHSELWLDFAEGMGAVREEVKTRQPILELRLLADIFRRLMYSAAKGLAALYTYESQNPVPRWTEGAQTQGALRSGRCHLPLFRSSRNSRRPSLGGLGGPTGRVGFLGTVFE